MTYDNILAKLRTDDLRSHFLFETFVLKLLDTELKKQGKTFDTHPLQKDKNLFFEPDAVAPQGIGDLIGPTLIELKSREARPGYGDWGRVIDRLAQVALHHKFKNVLIIHPKPLPETIREQLISRAGAAFPGNTKLHLWGEGELRDLVEKNSEYAAELVSQLAAVRLQSVIERRSPDWKERREEHVQCLRQAYAANDVTLFLGAGVSIEAGLPDWDTLLDALFVTLLTKTLEVRDDEVDQLVRRFRNIDDPSPLMAARYLRRGLAAAGRMDSFLSTITDVLYRLLDTDRAANSQLLSALARMCLPRRSGAKVRAVVSYNFDDLLETELEKVSVMHRSIFREGDLALRDELPVFHVHGFLPRERARYDDLGGATLVFSEEGYHEVFVDPYHWSNLVQLNLLREHTCLMLGLSLTDPNLRRLLEIAARRNGPGRHFAVLRRMRSETLTHDGDEQVVKARKSVVSGFLENHHKITEELFQELGLTIIWVEAHNEIPDLLRSIQMNE